MQNIRELMAIWPTITVLQQDLNVPASTLYSWRRRNSIQRKYWPKLVEAARKRGHPEVSSMLLAQIHLQPLPAQAGLSRVPLSLPQEHATGRDPGHFSRYRSVRAARYASLAEINDHVAALRDEWDR